jgi:hypothetical protein
MSTEADSGHIVIRGETINLKLPLDLSQWLRDEARRKGISVALLVNEVLREGLARDGYDAGPPVTESQISQMQSAADRDIEQDRSGRVP